MLSHTRGLLTVYECSTPTSSHTFGVPNPTFLEQPSPTDSVSDVEPNQLRVRRYTLAEQALVSTVKQFKPEADPRILQIQVLKQAMSLLDERAQDARDRAEELRLSLANRTIERRRYESLQRERWMEEKRQLAIDKELRSLRHQLDSFTMSPGNDDASGESSDPEARHRMNLARFFESSRIRAPIYTQEGSSKSFRRTPRRMTVGEVGPSRPRSHSVTSKFADTFSSHSRSMSLDGKKPQWGDSVRAPAPAPVPPLPFAQTQKSTSTVIVDPTSPRLSIVTEDTDDDSSALNLGLSPSTILSSPATSISIETPITESRRRRPWATARPPSHHDDNSHWRIASHSREGMATIYSAPYFASQAKPDNLDELPVSLPEYAQDLLEDFDYDYGFPLTLSPVNASSSSLSSIWEMPPPPPPLPKQKSHRSFFSIDHSAFSSSSFPSLGKLRRSASQRNMGANSLGSIPEAPTPPRESTSSSRTSLERKGSLSFFFRNCSVTPVDELKVSAPGASLQLVPPETDAHAKQSKSKKGFPWRSRR